MTTLKIGDRVRIRNGDRVFVVIEVDPVGHGFPSPPSTYLLTIRPVEGGHELVYGNAALLPAPEGGR